MQYALSCGIGLLMVVGCGAAGEAPPSSKVDVLVDTSRSSALADAEQVAGALDPSAPAPNLQRKIIYTAELLLIVNDFPAVEREIPKLVKQYGGYLADASVSRSKGEQRYGRWQTRIPVDR